MCHWLKLTDDEQVLLILKQNDLIAFKKLKIYLDNFLESDAARQWNEKGFSEEDGVRVKAPKVESLCCRGVPEQNQNNRIFKNKI